MSSAGAAPYEQLAELAERELELVGDCDLEQLDELVARRDAIISGLPGTPPPEAAPALERTALMQRRVAIELTRRREAVLLELAAIERARRMATGYAPVRRPGVRVQASA